MQHLFWALVAALVVRGAERGAANPGGCLKGVIKWLLIVIVALALLGWLMSGSCAPQT